MSCAEATLIDNTNNSNVLVFFMLCYFSYLFCWRQTCCAAALIEGLRFGSTDMLVGCGKGAEPVFAVEAIVGVVVERGIILSVEVTTLHFAPEEGEERFIVAFGQFVGHLLQQGICVVPSVEFVAVVVFAASKQSLEVSRAASRAKRPARSRRAPYAPAPRNG